PKARASSPVPGRSILITSAPRSPSICAERGPASTRVRSRILMPESGRADMVSSGVFSGFGGGTENRQTALASRYTISCFRVLHYEHEAMGNTHFDALPEDRRE